MRSSMLVLLFLHLVSVQAASTIEVHPIPQSPLQHPQPRSTPATTTIPTVDPKLFSKRRHRSPRVLFSERPPDAEPPEEHQGGGRGGRTRRRVVDPPQHRGVYSVCESVSIWVGNKTKATDISNNEVIVLPDVKINNVNKRQYFFETTCSNARAAGSGCLGIDGRHWNSYCTNSHTFVRALTSFKNLVAWRLIRINVACVCVLSRKSWRQ